MIEERELAEPPIAHKRNGRRPTFKTEELQIDIGVKVLWKPDAPRVLASPDFFRGFLKQPLVSNDLRQNVYVEPVIFKSRPVETQDCNLFARKHGVILHETLYPVPGFASELDPSCPCPT